MPNILDVQRAADAIIAAGQAYVAANPEGQNWYPCGFAWITYKCRKNAKEAGSLIARGFRWSDYEKEYTLSAGKFTNTQSMNYQEDILRAAVRAADPFIADGVTFRVRSRID